MVNYLLWIKTHALYKLIVLFILFFVLAFYLDYKYVKATNVVSSIYSRSTPVMNNNTYQGVILKLTESTLTIKEDNGKSRDFTLLIRTVFFSVNGSKMESSGLKVGNKVKFRTSPGVDGTLEIKRLEVTEVI